MDKRLSKKLDIHKDQVLAAYRNGMTMQELGDVHGVSVGTIRNFLIFHAEPIRTRGRGKSVPPTGESK